MLYNIFLRSLQRSPAPDSVNLKMEVVGPSETSEKSDVQQGISTSNTTNYFIIIRKMLQQISQLHTFFPCGAAAQRGPWPPYS